MLGWLMLMLMLMLAGLGLSMLTCRAAVSEFSQSLAWTGLVRAGSGRMVRPNPAKQRPKRHRTQSPSKPYPTKSPEHLLGPAEGRSRSEGTCQNPSQRNGTTFSSPSFRYGRQSCSVSNRLRPGEWGPPATERFREPAIPPLVSSSPASMGSFFGLDP